MVDRQRRSPACCHVPEDPLPIYLAYHSSQKRVGGDRARCQVEIAHVVTLEVKPSFMALNIDLCLEGWNKRKAAMREGTRGLPECSQPVEANIRRVRVSLYIQGATFTPDRHHEVDILCGFRSMKGSLQLIDLSHLCGRPAHLCERLREGTRGKRASADGYGPHPPAKVSPFHK